MNASKFRLLVLVFAILILGLPAGAALAQQRCFADKTPHCLDVPFGEYWQANGGLPVFGYPISSATMELNRDTQQIYLTQWVERNRLEDHPENQGTPYRVLLGLLGKERLAQVGRSWQAEPRESGQQAGCLWFAQTGHNVCDQDQSAGFKTYWESHGLAIPGLDRSTRSLQLFGLPLTSPRMETNSSGDTVLTQWFERARFEWHPTNPAAFKVLLGLLGNEVRSHQLTKNTEIIFSRSLSGDSDDLSTMNPDGSNLKALLSTPEIERAPAVSPDGKYVVYTVVNGITTDGSIADSRIERINRDGSGRVQLTTASLKSYSPRWSPDGKSILFESYSNGNWDLYAMKADGSSPVRLTSSPGDDIDGNWSPDGKKILFTSTRGSTASPPVADLYVMNADGAATVNLTNAPGDDRSGDWSPDGRKIVFTSTRDHHPDLAETELYTMNTDGRAVQRLTNDLSNEHNPTWSPDGTAIALTQRENTNNPHVSTSLMVIKPDGSNLKYLWGRADGGVGAFDWSPDSTSLVFLGNDRGVAHIWTIAATGNNPQQLISAYTTDLAWVGK